MDSRTITIFEKLRDFIFTSFDSIFFLFLNILGFFFKKCETKIYIYFSPPPKKNIGGGAEYIYFFYGGGRQGIRDGGRTTKRPGTDHVI